MPVGPGVVGVHVQHDAIDAQAEVAVEQGLEHGRGLVPCAAHLGESLCQDHTLAIDMGTTDGIEHVVGLVVGGRVEPELSHGVVGMAVVKQSVAHHRGGHALGGEGHAIALGRLLHLVEEHLVDKVGDGLPDVAEHLFGSGAAGDGHPGIDGQPGQQVVATPTGKLVGKLLVPVL